MAEVAKSEQPQTNGLENGLDEDERSKMRPADIDADVKEMERRKRVEMIMSSKLFREELERIIELQLKDGNGPAGLLQQISDMMGIQSGKLHTTHMFRGSNCVTPINDIRGVESMGYEKGEKNLRCKLASVFRLMDLYGWSQGINNQITARLNQDEEHFLVNPHGMLFNEITASSLVKVDMQGNIVEPGTTNFSVNTQGFLLHSAIHASRPDVNCVIHIKTPSVLAVSSLKCGLLPICQEALVIGEVSQHPFVSGIFEPEEREKIIRNLGPHNKVLLLHNHGAVCCGATVEEAFYNVYNTVLACETQMKLMPIGVENLLLVSDETRKQVYDAAHRAPDANAPGGDKKKFRVGEMEFEALIRMLDNAGFRTGYIYRHPLVKGELPKPKNDVEVPPAVSSLGYLIEQEELYKQGNWKKYIDGRNRLDRTKWLNSPNVYQKVEILETGTSDPKKITKWVDQNSEEWVAESSPTHSSTPVKIDSALQFVPKGTNPKEFKKLQQQIKENRRADKITSGPQSHILEGVSWEEAKKLQDANITQTGDQVILVGAASKGIIQRNYQHNALVYKTPYAKNPFDSMSDKEIEDYKQLVERKQRGDTDYEESQSESEAISSSRQDGLRHFKSPLLSPQSATSETEEESRDEPRVLRIETKTAPRPIQAEVVLSDGESDTTDARVERSHSARYPKAEKPESVTLMNSFRKSWSLKREKDKSKDVDNIYESRNLQFLKECELDRTESLHCYVARVKQLTHKPVIVDLGTKSLRPLLKSASDPCNLSTLNSENESDNRQPGASLDANTSLSCNSIANTSELQQRLKVRKKLLHTAKMKFLGYHNTSRENEVDDKNSKSPMRVLISEIRDTINEIMSPERSKKADDFDHYDSMRWIDRSKFVSRGSETKIKNGFDDLRNKSISKSMSSLNSYDAPSRTPSETFTSFKNDFTVLKMDLENSERSDTSNCNCAIHGGNLPEKTGQSPTDIVNASEDEATYTITEDSLLPTYSFTESTETEWYYNKTIMKLENSQTVLEIKECENKESGNLAVPVRYTDTGIDTDFTSDKEVEMKTKEQEEQKEPETTEDLDNDAPVLESSGLNKSSETDSSFLKSSSGRTSNDVDTSFAFKTETENSDKSPAKGSEEKKKFLEEMLLKTKEPIREESSDSEEIIPEKKKEPEVSCPKPEQILESPEFTNVDTEDAPITSSSKDTSPEILQNVENIIQVEQKPKVEFEKEEEIDEEEEEKENLKEHKKKKNLKSSTKITVKKELKEKNSKEPVVSEIRLTIKNSKKCQSEKYEVKIQDVTNTSEDLSRSVSTVDGYESFEIVDKSCECDAQQNLEELQEEVSSTIEKLQTIGNYFEDEIKKHSSPQKSRNGSDEFTIEYNYREFEEVLNESRSKMALLDKETFEGMKESTEFFVSSPLGEICGEIEVCDDVFDVGNAERETKNMEDFAMSSAFVAAVLSEAVLKVGEQVCEKFVEEGTPPAELEVICKVEELPDVAHFEETPGEVVYQEENVVLDNQDGEEEIQDMNQEVQNDIEDFWNNHMNQNEEPEEETTYQSCQSRFDLEKYEQEYQFMEETADWNKETQNERLEDEKLYQDCQQNFDNELVGEMQDFLKKELLEETCQNSQHVNLEEDGSGGIESLNEFQYCQHIVEEIIEEFGEVQNCQQLGQKIQEETKLQQGENEETCQVGQPLNLEEETNGIVLGEQQVEELNEVQYCQHIVEEVIEKFGEVQSCQQLDKEIQEETKLQQEEIVYCRNNEMHENEEASQVDQPLNLEEENNCIVIEEQKLEELNKVQYCQYIVEEIIEEVGEVQNCQQQYELEGELHNLTEGGNGCAENEIAPEVKFDINAEVQYCQHIVEEIIEEVGEVQDCQQLENSCPPVNIEENSGGIVLEEQQLEELNEVQYCQYIVEEIVEEVGEVQGCQQLCEAEELHSLTKDGNGCDGDETAELKFEKNAEVQDCQQLTNFCQPVNLEINDRTELGEQQLEELNKVQYCQHIVEEIVEDVGEVHECQQVENFCQSLNLEENAGVVLEEQQLKELNGVQYCTSEEIIEEVGEVQVETELQQDENEETCQVDQPLNLEEETNGGVVLGEQQLEDKVQVLNEVQYCQQIVQEIIEEVGEAQDCQLVENFCQPVNLEETSGGIVLEEQQLEDLYCQHIIEEIIEEVQGCQQLGEEETELLQEDNKETCQVYQHLNLEEEINGLVREEQQLEEINEVQYCQHFVEEIVEELGEVQGCQQVNEEGELQITKDGIEQPSVVQNCQQLNTESKNHELSKIPPEEFPQTDVTKFLNRPKLKALTFPPPLKAITYEQKNIPAVDYILNCVITTVVEKNKNSVNDVINFIVNNEESPTDSLAEFEDMENLISTSSSVVADIIDSIESQFEGEVESLPDEELSKETEERNRKKVKKDAMFKVTIATPAKKEIFINYSLDHSSTFNTTSDVDQIEELCNSYIKTDDVNEDFENLSSDNPDFFSIESSGKNSLNSSFCSVEEQNGKIGEQFCCVGCETYIKSPRSLAIIHEVDEGDSSASSEVAAT